MGKPSQENDDIPEGLRSSTPVNYSSTKKHDDVSTVQVKKQVVSSGSNIVSKEEQSKRNDESIKVWQDELLKAREKLKNGDPRAAGDIRALESELQRATGETPSANESSAEPSAQSTVDPDVAPSLSSASTVDYSTPKAQPTSGMSDRTKVEMGLGATVGAVVGNRQRKAEAVKTQALEDKYAHLPPEARPVNPIALQKYINSQFSVSIPLDKLKEVTGMDIRTMKEVQEARRMIEGREATREPVYKEVDGRKTPVSYRSTPAQQPIDISMYGSEPSIATKIKDAIASGTKSAATSALKYLSPIAGGAVALPQLAGATTDYLQNKPVDPTQVMSGVGGLAMMSGKTPFGVAGGLAQLPYAFKHSDEIAKNQRLSELVPDTVKMFMTGSEMYDPALPNVGAPKPRP